MREKNTTDTEKVQADKELALNKKESDLITREQSVAVREQEAETKLNIAAEKEREINLKTPANVLANWDKIKPILEANQ